MKLIEIKPYPKNAKFHSKKQIGQIADSIERFGFNQPIVVDKKNVIIVGHGRFWAAKLLGLEDVPVNVLNISEDEAKAYRLADNKLNESTWDVNLILEDLKSLKDLNLVKLTGFDIPSLEDTAVSFNAKNKKITDLGHFDHKCPKCNFPFND